MGWSLPPKTGTTTTRRTTAPPSTTAPGGTATATHPTSTASTCVGSTPPTRTALSGPPGPAGSTRSSFPRWRFGPPAIWKTNELRFCPCKLASSSHLVCWPTHTLWPSWLITRWFYFCSSSSILPSDLFCAGFHYPSLTPFSLKIILPSLFSLAFA